MQKALERVRDITEGWFSLTEEERNRYRQEIGPNKLAVSFLRVRLIYREYRAFLRRDIE